MASQEDISALREEMHTLVVNSINNLRETFSVSHQAINQSLAAITQQLDDSNLSNFNGSNAFKPKKFAGTTNDVYAFLLDLNIMLLSAGGKMTVD